MLSVQETKMIERKIEMFDNNSGKDEFQSSFTRWGNWKSQRREVENRRMNMRLWKEWNERVKWICEKKKCATVKNPVSFDVSFEYIIDILLWIYFGFTSQVKWRN